MTSNIARISLALVGAALAAGTTIGMAAAPALAAAPEHGTPAASVTVSSRWDHVDREDQGIRWDQGRSWAHGDSWSFGSTWSAGASWSSGSSYSRGRGWDRSGGWGWDDDDRDGDRIAGFFRSYRQCQRAGYVGALSGDWEDFSCDFTRRGWGGWNEVGRFGDNDWRCDGTWVLRVDDVDED